MYTLVLGTPHCVEAGVGYLAKHECVGQTCLIQRHDFLLPDRAEGVPQPEHVAAMNAVYLVCWSTCHAMTRLESKEVRHKDYHPEVVLMTPPRKTALLAPAMAFTLPSRPTELDTQKEAPPYGDGKPASHFSQL
jgi:hypothetical protein